jgi:TolB-like protein
MRAVLLALLFTLPTVAQDAELRELSTNLAGVIHARAKSPIAVTTFVSEGCGPSFGQFVSNRLNILLTQSGKPFEVVTRNRLNDAMKEINLRIGQNYDAASFAKLGKIVGAKALVRGDYHVFESKVSLNAEVIEVESGQMIGGHFVDVPLTADVKGLIRCGVDAPASATPKREPAENTSSKATLAPPTVSPSSMQSAEAGGVVFTLRGCQAKVTEVNCQFSATSPKEDRYVHLGYWHAYSSLFDQDGNEYRITRVSAANKSDHHRIETLLVRDVAVQVTISFAVKRDVTGISLLRFVGGTDNRQFMADFRNISVRP